MPAWSTISTTSPTRANTTTYGCTHRRRLRRSSPGGAQRAASLHRHRTRRQLHRRSTRNGSSPPTTGARCSTGARPRRAAHSQSAHYLDAIDRDDHNPVDLNIDPELPVALFERPGGPAGLRVMVRPGCRNGRRPVRADTMERRNGQMARAAAGAVAEEEVAALVAAGGHGSGLLQAVDRPLHGVALPGGERSRAGRLPPGLPRRSR